jgi:hypothetical protein
MRRMRRWICPARPPRPWPSGSPSRPPRPSGDYGPELRAFLSANDVRAIVVAPGSRFARDVAFLAPLRLRGLRVDGAMVYRVMAGAP